MRKLLLLAVLLTLGAGAKAQEVTFSIDNVEIPQGGTVQIPFNVTNSFAIKGAFQGQLGVEGIDLNGEILKVEGKFVGSERVIEPSASGNFVSDLEGAETANVEYRMTLHSTGDNDGNTAIKENSGAIGYLTLSASEAAEIGAVYNAHLRDIHVATTGNVDIKVNNVDFTIKVVENIVVLDDEVGVTSDMAAENVKVQVKRAISANNWNTLCLPFDMTENQVKAAFGDGVKLAEFIGCESELNDDDDATAIHLHFSSITTITANRPCVISVANAVTHDDGFTVEGVTINPSEDLSIDYDDNFMTGTYDPSTILAEKKSTTSSKYKYQYIFLSGNNFYYATDQTRPMKAFRAYFDLDGFDASTITAGVKIRFSIDDEATSINGVSEITKVANGVYSVTGAKVSEDSLEGLPAGVYIVNGKKVYKK